MKRIISFLLVILIGLSLIPQDAQAAQFATVTGGWLRLRSYPSFSAQTISSYYTGTRVEILDSTSMWYHVRVPDGYTGYMYKTYLNTSGGGGGTVGYVTSSNGKSVNMRTGPSTTYSVIYSYRVGTTVNVINHGSTWSYININGVYGYMMSQFISVNTPTPPTPSANATVWSGNGYGVRLRTGPSTDYDVIGKYDVGTPIKVISYGEYWSYIQIGSRTGYMMTEFIRNYDPVNNITSLELSNNSPSVHETLSTIVTPKEATVSYKWLVNNIPVSYESTYYVLPSDAGKKIQVVVSGTGNYTGSLTKTSEVVRDTEQLTVKITPEVTEVKENSSIIFTANVSGGTGTYNYMWQRLNLTSNEWINVGENSQNFSTGIFNKEKHDGIKYRCIVTDLSGKIGEDTTSALKITSTSLKAEFDKYDAFKTVDDTLTLTVKNISGDSVPYTFYWEAKKNKGDWNIISGATSSTYTTPKLTLDDNLISYRCTIKGATSQITIISEQIRISKKPSGEELKVTLSQNKSEFTVGEKVQLKANVSGGTLPYKYQWQRLITTSKTWQACGTNSDTFVSGEFKLMHSGIIYRCVVTDAEGVKKTVESSPIIVTNSVKDPSGSETSTGETTTPDETKKDPSGSETSTGETTTPDETKKEPSGSENSSGETPTPDDTKIIEPVELIASFDRDTRDGINIKAGETITLTVTVNGGVQPYKYQWRSFMPDSSKGKKIACTSHTFESNPFTTAQSGVKLTCTITDSTGKKVTAETGQIIVE